MPADECRHWEDWHNMKKNEYYEKLKKMAEADNVGTKASDREDINGAVSGEDDSISAQDAAQDMPELNMEGSREYEVLIGVKDMQHFVIRHMYRSFTGWFGVVISAAAIVMLIMGWNVYGNMEKIALIVLSLLFTVVQPVQLLMKAKRQVLSQETFKTPIIYNLCRDGIVVRQDEQKVSILWDDISKFVETRKAFFLYTSPVRAFIFPKAAVGDAAEFSKIVREALKR